MNVDIQGIVKGFGDLFERDNFVKKDLIIETTEQFKNIYAIEFVKDRMDILNKVSPGDSVTVKCNLRGREWIDKDGNTKHYVSLQGWAINT